MRVIIGNQYYPSLDGSSVQIARSVTDPVPTCSLNLIDVDSSLNPQNMQEILVLDDKQIPNPAYNMLLNPALNPYTTSWTVSSPPGVTFSSVGGGGVRATMATSLTTPLTLLNQITQLGSISPGQTYCFSIYVQGGSSPTNFHVFIQINWLDATQNLISSFTVNGSTPPSTSLTRYINSQTAPVGAVYANLVIGVQASAGDSGTVTFTQAQFEPQWFPIIAYPTPWCGPSQTNCVQLPLGFWIRQYRKFAGFVNHIVAQDYHGNVRTLQINAVGYAWLLATILANDGFTNQADSTILTTLLNKYLVSNGIPMVNTSQIVTGVSDVSSLQSNWDDLRTNADNLDSLSMYYWTIDSYWNFIYAPPGHYLMPISLICDDSVQPDMVTTFPAYNFSAEQDFTQPGSTVLVLGNGSNTALVSDPTQTAALGALSGYMLPATQSWMRKVNDSTLESVADCTTRGVAELLQYNFSRNIYHLCTNVELIPGEAIRITSATEGLSQSLQLIQQTTATWLGTNELLQDEWEYQSDLGAINRRASHMISRIFRLTQQGSSAPAIGATTLELAESAITFEDIYSTGSILPVTYLAAIQPDTPLALYSLGELVIWSGVPSDIFADDLSGNAHLGFGTGGGGITPGVSGLLIDAADSSATAWKFDGSSGLVSLSTAFTPTGNNPWSIEAWFSVSAFPSVNGMICAFGNVTTKSDALLYVNSTGQVVADTDNGPNVHSAAISLNTTHYAISAYDGTHVWLSVDGQPFVQSSATGPLTVGNSYASIGAWNPSPGFFFAGTIQYVGIYNYKLTNLQAATHYAAGTSLYAYQVMLDTPAGYYRLNETSGTTANDRSSNARNGTYNGGFTLNQTSLLFNDAGKATTFNGTTGDVTLPTSVIQTGANHAWTLECWCKAVALPTSGNLAALVVMGQNAAAALADLSIKNTSGTSNFNLSYNSGNVTGATVVSTGTVYHVVATYDGMSIRLYVNGNLDAGPTSVSLTLGSTFASIGANSSGASQFFSGTVEEAAIYGAALSAARITAHYNMGTLGHL